MLSLRADHASTNLFLGPFSAAIARFPSSGNSCLSLLTGRLCIGLSGRCLGQWKRKPRWSNSASELRKVLVILLGLRSQCLSPSFDCFDITGLLRIALDII